MHLEAPCAFWLFRGLEAVSLVKLGTVWRKEKSGLIFFMPASLIFLQGRLVPLNVTVFSDSFPGGFIGSGRLAWTSSFDAKNETAFHL
jgi:hypothetical protein